MYAGATLVVTAGGIVGRVVKAPAKDDPEVTVEIAENVQVRVLPRR